MTMSGIHFFGPLASLHARLSMNQIVADLGSTGRETVVNASSLLSETAREVGGTARCAGTVRSSWAAVSLAELNSLMSKVEELKTQGRPTFRLSEIIESDKKQFMEL